MRIRSIGLVLSFATLVGCELLAVNTRQNDALTLTAATTQVPAGTQLQIAAAGGSPPYIYSVLDTSLAGEVDSQSGLYTAPTTSTTDRVYVKDAVGQLASLDIEVTAAFALSAASTTALTGEQKTLEVVGGAEPFVFSVTSGGGTVSDQGVFVSDWVTETSTVSVTDFLGNVASLDIQRNATARLLGSSASEAVSASAIGSEGSVFIAGATNGVLDGQTASGNYDAFIVKMNSKGVVLWIRQFGTTGYDKIHDLKLDSAGNVYAVGEVGGALPSATQVGGVDAFIRKYSTDGDILWTSQFGSNTTDRAFALAVDNTNSVLYVGGHTYGTMDGANAGSGDLFLQQMSLSGSTVWTDQTGTPYLDYVRGVAVDPSGFVYITGTLGYATGASPSFNGVAYTQFATPSFVVKYSSAGSVLWTLVPSNAGNYPYSGYSLIADANGGLYVSFRDDDAFVNNNYGMVVVKYSTHNGAQVWANDPSENYGSYVFPGGLSLDTSNNPVLGSSSYSYFSEVGHYQFQAVITKFNASTGAELWNAVLGNVDNTTLGIGVVSDTSKENFFLFGITNAVLGGYAPVGGFDAFVMKYSTAGVAQ
jgi:hypothetical protein